MKIGFFGTPELARRILHDLLSAEGIEVVFAVTNPDKPIGRSQELHPSPVRALADARSIPVYTPVRVR
jgi:methionyl-tRNA formyltransferase